LFCDLRFASDQAMFTTAFAQRGLIAEHGSSWVLPRLLGPARALDLLMSARRVQAAEAAAIGLVNQTFAHATFMDDVLAYARKLTESVSPRSLAVMKAQVWQSLSQPMTTALDVADREMKKSFTSADFKEGVAHFVEKRAPRFSGR
jgi:enoyl-CoA hydratase/carnithine racemase